MVRKSRRLPSYDVDALHRVSLSVPARNSNARQMVDAEVMSKSKMMMVMVLAVGS